MEPHGKGAKYSALAMHKNEASRNTHDRMGSATVGVRRSINSSHTPKRCSRGRRQISALIAARQGALRDFARAA